MKSHRTVFLSFSFSIFLLRFIFLRGNGENLAFFCLEPLHLKKNEETLSSDNRCFTIDFSGVVGDEGHVQLLEPS